MRPGTRDSRPGTHTWDPGPRSLHLGPFTWDPGPLPGTRDLGPFKSDPEHETKCGTLIRTEYIETSPMICSDWFLCDGEIRYERVI